MYFPKLLSVLLCFLMFSACQTEPAKEVVTKIDASNIEKFCLQQDAAVTSNGFLLKNQSSAITSKFKVKNFELTVKLKTTVGAEGSLFFASSDGGDSANGYEVKINNSDYRIGALQKTGSLSKIRNNFVRTAADDEWFTLRVNVNENHVEIIINNKTVSDYEEPVNIRKIGRAHV